MQVIHRALLAQCVPIFSRAPHNIRDILSRHIHRTPSSTVHDAKVNPSARPFLTDIAVDEVNAHASAILPLTLDHLPQLRGHFPSQPVLPAVLTLNAMFHLAAVLHPKAPDAAEEKPPVSHLVRAAFRRVVTPEHLSLRIEVRLEHDQGRVEVQRPLSALIRATATLHREEGAPQAADALFRLSINSS